MPTKKTWMNTFITSTKVYMILIIIIHTNHAYNIQVMSGSQSL